MPEQGGTNLFLFNLVKQRASKKDPEFTELGITSQGDVIINPAFSGRENDTETIETSLVKYLQYLYVEYPSWVRIKVNDKPISLANPCSLIKRYCPGAYLGEKTEKFAV